VGGFLIAIRSRRTKNKNSNHSVNYCTRRVCQKKEEGSKTAVLLPSAICRFFLL
jgi:hypothetical protein